MTPTAVQNKPFIWGGGGGREGGRGSLTLSWLAGAGVGMEAEAPWEWGGISKNCKETLDPGSFLAGVWKSHSTGHEEPELLQVRWIGSSHLLPSCPISQEHGARGSKSPLLLMRCLWAAACQARGALIRGQRLAAPSIEAQLLPGSCLPPARGQGLAAWSAAQVADSTPEDYKFHSGCCVRSCRAYRPHHPVV